MSRFSKLQGSIERKEGYSAGRAAAIAAAVGRKKYGEKKMAQLSAEGRRRASKPKAKQRSRESLASGQVPLGGPKRKQRSNESLGSGQVPISGTPNKKR